MKKSPFTRVEDFNPNEVKDAMIELAKEGVPANTDGGYAEFVRENESMFPGLDTSNADAMQHAESLCREVYRLNEDEIAENWND